MNEPTSPQRGAEQWVSVRAIAWVLDEAPDVPAALVTTLLGFARHADQQGRNSYPSVETLVKYTRKSERQVRNDIKALRQRGLVVVAEDQSPAGWIRGDRRPTVYHLPIPDPGTGCSTPHVVDDTSSGLRGAVQRSTGCSTASNGVQWTAPEEDKNKTKKKTKSLSRPTTSAAMLAAHGVPEEEREDLIKNLEFKHKVDSFGWWITTWNGGDLPDRIRDARKEPATATDRHNNGGRHQPYRDSPDTAKYHAEL